VEFLYSDVFMGDVCFERIALLSVATSPSILTQETQSCLVLLTSLCRQLASVIARSL
jgi:hypothetical protein